MFAMCLHASLIFLCRRKLCVPTSMVALFRVLLGPTTHRSPRCVFVGPQFSRFLVSFLPYVVCIRIVEPRQNSDLSSCRRFLVPLSFCSIGCVEGLSTCSPTASFASMKLKCTYRHVLLKDVLIFPSMRSCLRSVMCVLVLRSPSNAR